MVPERLDSPKRDSKRDRDESGELDFGIRRIQRVVRRFCNAGIGRREPDLFSS